MYAARKAGDQFNGKLTVNLLCIQQGTRSRFAGRDTYAAPRLLRDSDFEVTNRVKHQQLHPRPHYLTAYRIWYVDQVGTSDGRKPQNLE